MILDQLSQPFALSKAAVETQEALTKAIERHNQACADLTESIDRLRAVQDINWTQKHESESAKLRSKRTELLKAELELRAEIAEYLDAVANAEVPAAINSAIAEYEAATDEVRSKVLEIGFMDDPYQRTIAEIVARHPSVKAARMRTDANRPQPPLAAIAANNEGIKRAKAELAELRRSATAGLPEPERDFVSTH